MKEHIAIGPNECLSHEEAPPVTFGDTQYHHDISGPCRGTKTAHLLRIYIYRMMVILQAVIINIICLVPENKSWVPGNPKFGKGDDLSTICGSLLNK